MEERIPLDRESYFYFLSEPPSLMNIASVSIAIKLWEAAGMNELMATQHQIQQCHRQNIHEAGVHFELAYSRLEERALKKLNELILPESLKLNVTQCMMPIGLQFRWSTEHNRKEYCRFYDLYKKGGLLYWTMEGVLDQVKSLKELIINAVTRKDLDYFYKLACKYCLEEDILDLWEKAPSAKTMQLNTLSILYKTHILAYWAAVQNNVLPHLLTKILLFDPYNIYNPDLGIYENLILLSIYIGNPFAFKYFWFKLSDHEKYVNIENWVTKLTGKIKRHKYTQHQTYDVHTDMLWFLLAQEPASDPEKGRQIINCHSKILFLSLCFYWPFQRFLVPAMFKLMSYIHIDTYASIMKDLVSETKGGRLTEEQFRAIWHYSPLQFQNHFLSIINSKPKARLFMLSTLLLAGEIPTICIILNNDSPIERNRFVTNLIQSNLKRLIQESKLRFANALLSKEMSESDINTFKQHVMVTYANDYCCDCMCKLNYNATEQFLNWGFQSLSEIQNFKKSQLNLNEIFISLIQLGDFGHADRFLSWCFDSETEVNQFINGFVSEDNILYFEKLVFRLSSLDKYGWDIFENFLNHISLPSPKIKILKKLLLKEVGHIVEAHNLIFATRLLNWCLPDIVKSNQYKYKLLLSRRGINSILEALLILPKWDKVRSLLEWFFPLSKEIVDKLKYTLITKKFRSGIYPKKNQRRALFHVLDLFVESYNNPNFKGLIDFDWRLKGYEIILFDV
ncbi:uncharacterized protein [Parasteatoda tepidariorum]|uniref:uncharacterized protein n=1 Tax=Parasteatoda tepidariorum TaxID=114398 RepID=UPI00077FCB48|nr:uncharacterized protein LOC107454892 [Parasteatoda tepidariorum]